MFLSGAETEIGEPGLGASWAWSPLSQPSWCSGFYASYEESPGNGVPRQAVHPSELWDTSTQQKSTRKVVLDLDLFFLNSWFSNRNGVSREAVRIQYLRRGSGNLSLCPEHLLIFLSSFSSHHILLNSLSWQFHQNVCICFKPRLTLLLKFTIHAVNGLISTCYYFFQFNQ